MKSYSHLESLFLGVLNQDWDFEDKSIVNVLKKYCTEIKHQNVPVIVNGESFEPSMEVLKKEIEELFSMNSKDKMEILKFMSPDGIQINFAYQLDLFLLALKLIISVVEIEL